MTYIRDEEDDDTYHSPDKLGISAKKLAVKAELHEFIGAASPCRHRIKLDYGWKTLLRGMRQCLREAMDTSSMFQGRHHWSD